MISAVVLTHNSALTVQATLQSLAWADELVVVDDESTDDTIGIAKKQNAMVFSHPLLDDFAAQRNFGLSCTTGEWVLFVDSDEMVSDQLAHEMQIISKEPSDIKGYMIKREDEMWGKVLRHGETERVRLLRFARRDVGVWVRPVHETWDIKGLIGELRNPLAHTPHPDVAQFLESVSRYSTTNAQYLYTQKMKVYAWHIVAYPLAKFFVNYVWRLGLLDGTRGAIMACMMSFHSFLVRSKLWLLYHKKHTIA